MVLIVQELRYHILSKIVPWTRTLLASSTLIGFSSGVAQYAQAIAVKVLGADGYVIHNLPLFLELMSSFKWRSDFRHVSIPDFHPITYHISPSLLRVAGLDWVSSNIQSTGRLGLVTMSVNTKSGTSKPWDDAVRSVCHIALIMSSHLC